MRLRNIPLKLSPQNIGRCGKAWRGGDGVTYGRGMYMAGSGGMLGWACTSVWGATHELKCTDIDVNAPWLSRLDYRDYDAYRANVLEFRPDYLFHLGAHTSLEYC